MTVSPPALQDLDSAVRVSLAMIRRRFYAGQPARLFHRDRRALTYALTWPAGWLQSRGLACSPARYQALLTDRFDAIAAHGDPAHFGRYFPAYLLKCLQDCFQHRGDELYAELKHVRDAIDQVLGAARFSSDAALHARHIEILAATHRLLQTHRSTRTRADGNQLSLF